MKGYVGLHAIDRDSVSLTDQKTGMFVYQKAFDLFHIATTFHKYYISWHNEGVRGATGLTKLRDRFTVFSYRLHKT